MDPTAIRVLKRRLGDPEDRSDVLGLTPAARFELVGVLTIQAWTFARGSGHESRLQRNAVRVIRGRR